MRGLPCWQTKCFCKFPQKIIKKNVARSAPIERKSFHLAGPKMRPSGGPIFGPALLTGNKKWSLLADPLLGPRTLINILFCVHCARMLQHVCTQSIKLEKVFTTGEAPSKRHRFPAIFPDLKLGLPSTIFIFNPCGYSAPAAA